MFDDIDEHSDLIDRALYSGGGGSGKRRGPRNQNRGNSSVPAVALTPISLLPNSANPLLTNPDGSPISEEFTCLDGDDEEAQFYDKIVSTSEANCVYCEHGSCSEHSKTELDQIIELEEKNYGMRSDKANFEFISAEYNRRIYGPLRRQQEIKKQRREPTKDIPNWTMEEVAHHFMVDGLYPHRELGGDIKTISRIQNQLRFKGLAKKTENGKAIDVDNTKLFIMLSKQKEGLIKTYTTLYPHLSGRQKKNPFEGQKPTGAK